MSKSESVLQCHTGLLPNKREGTSAIVLRFPSICMGVRGHARWDLRHSAKACIKCSAMVYCPKPFTGVEEHCSIVEGRSKLLKSDEK